MITNLSSIDLFRLHLVQFQFKLWIRNAAHAPLMLLCGMRYRKLYVRNMFGIQTGATVPILQGGAKRVAYHNKKYLQRAMRRVCGDVPIMRSGEMYLIES
jgi:hypothetical protein